VDKDGKQGSASNAHKSKFTIKKEPRTLEEVLQYIQDNPSRCRPHHAQPKLDRVEELASFFGSGTFAQGSASADTAGQRMRRVVASTEHFAVPGLKTGGIVSGWHDEGFNLAFKDPHPSSDNQVGHFLTSVNLGLNPNSVESKSDIIRAASDFSTSAV